MTLSLQYCKLNRKNEDSAEEWMGRLSVIAVECSYKENYRITVFNGIK